ncbi:MAG: hypothetical protein IJO43_01890 [Bacilli bacterium]|nr:hypothetical protein [Bacilli bacterium]
MMKRLGEILKKYKLSILIATIILILGLIVLMIILAVTTKGVGLKDFTNDNYKFEYDSTWSIKSEEEQKVVLCHENDSKLEIEIVKLEDQYKYSQITELIDELTYDISEQNKKFELLNVKATKITKNKYSGYKLLYENDDSQAMIIVSKLGDKLLLFTYEAKHTYFDILLDSVQNIIYNFEIVEQKPDLSYSLKLETSEIDYQESNDVEKLLNKTTEQEIASHFYHVKYSIPDNFKTGKIDSTSGYFHFRGWEEETSDKEIFLSVYIYNKNIYEHLDKEKAVNVYSEWNFYKSDPDYSKFEESLEELNSGYESYIYKNSYYYDKAMTWDENFNVSYTSQLNENVVMMYALDKNHLMLFEISSKGVAIPEKLINMIKIETAEKYSSYLPSTKENGYIISSLKRMTSSTTGTVDEIKLKVPEKYTEIDKSSLLTTNVYEQRYYVLDYIDTLETYKYEVKYTLTGTYAKIDNQAESVNNTFSRSYGEYKDLTYIGERTINDKKFYIYEGGYTDIAGIMFTSKNRVKYYTNVKLLFYELSNGGYLMIQIDGNNSEISESLLEEFTNFDIEIKNN